MTETLRLKINGNDFPENNSSPAEIGAFRFNAKRMGKAPSLSATIAYPQCLDKEWSDAVYVEFRGEKYYLKQAPPSSYDNSSMMYKHTVEFVSERVVLESVYFFDVVDAESETDAPVANSSTFSFFGDLTQLAERLTRSMKWSGLNYTVVVDDDVACEEQLVQVQDQFLEAVLQSAYDIFEVPYYYEGTTIHFGYASNILTTPLRYGFNDALISINKNISNAQIVNRITGTGSNRNITYYYPNPTPKGHLKLGGASASKYKITNEKLFSSQIDLGRTIIYSGVAQGEILQPSAQSYEHILNTDWASLPFDGLDVTNSADGFLVRAEFVLEDGSYQSTQLPIRISAQLDGEHIYPNSIITEARFWASLYPDDVETLTIGTNGYWVATEETISYVRNRKYVLELKVADFSALDANSHKLELFLTGYDSYISVDVSYAEYGGTALVVEAPLSVYRNAPGRFEIAGSVTLGSEDIDVPSNFMSGSIAFDDEASNIVRISEDTLRTEWLESGEYTMTLRLNIDEALIGSTLSTANWVLTGLSHWEYEDGGILPSGDLGFGLVDGAAASAGDAIQQQMSKRVNVQNTLMPSIYRSTDGAERFYNAENDKYKDDDGNDIIFNNPYSSSRPREHIEKFDDIYPSIEGMVNSNGLRIDMFSEFAFDENDNDEVYPVGHEREGKYKHPYFFGKLCKFDGANGFNLFDHAIEGQPMTISMTSGKCGGCEFTIGVDEATSSFNTVQVTLFDIHTVDGVIPAGSLVRDDEGNVLCGRWPQAPQQKQARQNDTQNYEVWIALKKDIQTFGVVMPNATNAYRPSAGDQFVILNIDLPEAYVTAAEDKLEKAIIDYMAENNDYKFNFSVKFSRIFFEENPDIANLINENAKVTLEYNGVERDLYVSSFAYSASANDALPEVTIELSDDIKIFKSSIQKEQEQLYKVVEFNYKILSAKDNESLKFSQKTETTAKNASATAQTALESSLAIKTDLKVVKSQAAETNLIVNKVASDRQTFKIEHQTVLSEKETIDSDFVGFLAQWTPYIDTSDDEYITSDGEVYEVREENDIWARYLSAYNAYDKELQAIIHSTGVVETSEITASQLEYYTAKVALLKAISTEQKANISDLDYLKQAFGADNVADSDGVTLSRMMSVKDTNANVVAGMYGGGVENLDSIGYDDPEHGTMMIFAGATSAQTVRNAKYRVYEDGTAYIKEGIFEGIIKHRIVNITKMNITSILPPTETTIEGYTRYRMSPMLMSAIMNITNEYVSLNNSYFTVSDSITFAMPVLYGFTLYDADSIANTAELRGLVGTRFIVYNNTPALVHFCGKRYNSDDKTFSDIDQCYNDWIIGEGKFATAECKLELDGSNREVIYWDIKVGRHRQIVLPA